MNSAAPAALAREHQLHAWLQPLAATHGLRLSTLGLASGDASVRRYFRVQTEGGPSLIVMDDPASPNQMAPFVTVGAQMARCGLHVPVLHAVDAEAGFALMEDLGEQSYLRALLDAQRREDRALPARLMREASVALLQWQLLGDASQLPAYDEAFVRRELQIFVDWCVQGLFGRQWNAQQQAWWEHTVALLVRNALEQPQVPMHRDFMVRNLMVMADADGRPGVLDFQDAVRGPVSYDMGSLLRDAFISWDEEEELDWAVRYWEGLRKSRLLGDGDAAHPMAQDFGLFWRALEWTVLQRQLKIMGIFSRLKLRDGKPAYAEDLPRFFAYTIKTASRYVELAPLLRLLEDLQPQFVQTGFSLR